MSRVIPFQTAKDILRNSLEGYVCSVSETVNDDFIIRLDTGGWAESEAYLLSKKLPARLNLTSEKLVGLTMKFNCTTQYETYKYLGARNEIVDSNFKIPRMTSFQIVDCPPLQKF
jgi:hypothetical protein